LETAGLLGGQLLAAGRGRRDERAQAIALSSIAPRPLRCVRGFAMTQHAHAETVQFVHRRRA
jgi:hypothetical protein